VYIRRITYFHGLLPNDASVGKRFGLTGLRTMSRRPLNRVALAPADASSFVGEKSVRDRSTVLVLKHQDDPEVSANH
jgi:hypothetical protein